MSSSKSPIHIVGICGSLRKSSYNRGLLRAFEQQLPEHVTFTLADIADIPFFNEDHEQPYPDKVVKLKELLDSADAVVISSPEYNLSYSVVLKNALEWVSRRALQTKLAGKPVALVGVAAIGVAVSQSHLRDVMLALNMNLLNRPIVHVGNAREKFNQNGNLTDSHTKELLVQLSEALIAAVQKQS